MIYKKFLLLLLLPLFINGQNFPDKPANYVTDIADVLSEEQESALNAKCKAFEDSTSSQIFVYTAPSLEGQDMTVLCQEIFTKWEIGQAGKDNGLLIAVFPDNREFRIHTGYGLEGVLPDILTKKIQDETMRPHFKKQDYFTGISEGIDQLIYYSKHEFVPEKESKTGLIVFIAVFLTICYGLNGMFLWATRSGIKENTKKSEAAKKMARTLANIFFFIPFAGAFLMVIIMLIFGTKRGGGRGGSSRSGGWGGSSSGSSFGGGGGGRSGGGGSSSSW